MSGKVRCASRVRSVPHLLWPGVPLTAPESTKSTALSFLTTLRFACAGDGPDSGLTLQRRMILCDYTIIASSG